MLTSSSRYNATVDGCEIHFAPPKKPWNHSIPLQIATNNGCNHGFKVVRNGFRNHPQYELPFSGEVIAWWATHRLLTSRKRPKQGGGNTN